MKLSTSETTMITANELINVSQDAINTFNAGLITKSERDALIKTACKRHNRYRKTPEYQKAYGLA